MTDDRATQIQRLADSLYCSEVLGADPAKNAGLCRHGSHFWRKAERLYEFGARIPDPPAQPEPEPWVVVSEEAIRAYMATQFEIPNVRLRAALPHLIAANRRRIVREMAEAVVVPGRDFLLLNRPDGSGGTYTVDDLVAALVPEEKEKGVRR